MPPTDNRPIARPADSVAAIGSNRTAWRAADLADNPPPAWLRWTGPILSFAIILVVAGVLGRQDLGALWRMTPASAGFWIVAAIFLAIQPVCDFLIFRGLWPLPVSGLAALFRKSASNELLVGYSGELQFYIWARQNAAIPGSPFGAVRDVAVLSALVGNIITVALLLAAIALPGDLEFGSMEHAILWSGVVLIASSVAIMLFRRHLFAVSRGQFWRIGAIHLARSIAITLTVAILWAIVTPAVSPGWWLLLAAARQFVTRLPFLPNKDLVFAGLAAHMLKSVPDIGETVALVAGMIFAGQVLIGAVLALVDLARETAIGKAG